MLQEMSWWVLDVLHGAGPIVLAAWIFWVIFSITLHELAHGHTAIRLGDDTPIRSGHMTFNPLVHMGPMSLLFFALVGIAWGMMPVDPSRLRGRLGHAKVAAAGPLANFLIALFCILAAALVQAAGGALPGRSAENLFTFLAVGAQLNVVLGLLNLLPVPPLDGFTVLDELWPAFHRFARHPMFPQTSLFLLLLILWKGGPYLFGTAAAITGGALDWIGNTL